MDNKNKFSFPTLTFQKTKYRLSSKPIRNNPFQPIYAMNPFSLSLVKAPFSTFLVLVVVTSLTNILAALAQTATTTKQDYVTEQPLRMVPTGLRSFILPVEGSLTFSVHYENLAGGLVEIRILDQVGSVLYKNLFSNIPKKVTTYNLSSLEDGIYTSEVSTLWEKYRKSFAIQTKPIRAATPVKNEQMDEQLTLYKLRQPDKP